MTREWLPLVIGLCVVGSHYAVWVHGRHHGRRQEKRYWRRWLRTLKSEDRTP